jgi:hypothetical protein
MPAIVAGQLPSKHSLDVAGMTRSYVLLNLRAATFGEETVDYMIKPLYQLEYKTPCYFCNSASLTMTSPCQPPPKALYSATRSVESCASLSTRLRCV